LVELVGVGGPLFLERRARGYLGWWFGKDGWIGGGRVGQLEDGCVGKLEMLERVEEWAGCWL
jgi:hypothetical protein